MRAILPIAVLVVCGFAQAGERASAAALKGRPVVTKIAGGVKIAFAVSAATDVEAAVLNAAGKVVRHLAAGVLGGAKAPPSPLRAGLSQELLWDGKDDYGRPAAGGPFRVRVRAGCGLAFGRFIGADPYNVGAVDSIAADEAGNVYVMGFGGEANQGQMVLRVFGPDGRYVREILPFPADLPPGAMKDIARWDPNRGGFLPRQLKNLNPDFYDGRRHGCLHVFAASRAGGVLLTDGARVCKLDARGAVPEGSFAFLSLWPAKGALPNTGGGPTYLRASPDGRWLYLSGPYSSKTAYGHKADPRFPPGQVYRMEIGKGAMAPFAKLPTVGENPAKPGFGWISKHISHPSHYGVPHGPIHGLAVDAGGNVLVADQDNQCVAVFDSAGRRIGQADVAYPDVLAVHPTTGAVYVLTKEIKGYHRFRKTLVKLAGWKDAKQVAELDLGTDAGAMPQMALAAGEGRTVLWLSGLGGGGLLAIEDTGDALRQTATAFAPRSDVPADWNRLAVDHDRDEVYVSNGTTRVWRYDGLTGRGGILRKNDKDFLANDLAVGYDGNLYVRVSGVWDGSAADYSGPFWRLTRDLAPAPFAATGTHVLSRYIYSRYGIGFAERGIGVGPDGTSYVSFMYKWVAYAIGGFAPDGKPIGGRYLKGEFPTSKPEDRKRYPAGMDGAVIGPVPLANGGIRVDLAGDIYVGMSYWPKDADPPDGFAMDEVWKGTVGSVVKFRPDEGGAMAGKEGAFRAESITGAVGVYPGLAPFSMPHLGGNTCCVCRGPRFDIDRYGRLALPNAVTCSVWLYDNAGNLIAEFGRYGNFDSQYAASPAKPAVAAPAIPLAWPTGAGLSEDHVYVNDTYARRVVRADKTWQSEAVCPVELSSRGRPAGTVFLVP